MTGLLAVAAVWCGAGCGEKGAGEAREVDSAAAPAAPANFHSRADIKACGTLSVRLESLPRVSRVSDPAYDCFLRAAEAETAAEIRAISLNEEGRVTEYFRTLGSDGAEIYSDTRRGGNGKPGFYLHPCESIDLDLKPHGCALSVFVGR